MRHKRKSKHQRIDGYKRHVATDLVTKLILACCVTPANRPEAEATPALEADLTRQGLSVDALYIDQAYAHSQMAAATLARGGQVFCRPRSTPIFAQPIAVTFSSWVRRRRGRGTELTATALVIDAPEVGSRDRYSICRA